MEQDNSSSQSVSYGLIDNLIEKIKVDGFARAEDKAKEIIDEAKLQAADIISSAKHEVESARESFQKEIELERERVKSSIELAIRDLILQLHKNIEKFVHQIMKDDLSRELSGDRLVRVVDRIIDLWIDQFPDGISVDQLNIALPQSQSEELANGAIQRLRDKLNDGGEIVLHPDLDFGLKLSISNQSFHHNLTPQAISDGIKILIGDRLSEYLSSKWTE